MTRHKPRPPRANIDTPAAGGKKPGAAKPRRPRYEFIPRAPGTSPQQQAEWRARHHRPVAPADLPHLLAYYQAIVAAPSWSADSFSRLARRLARQGHPIFSKAYVRRAILSLIASPTLDAPPPRPSGEGGWGGEVQLFLSRTTTKPVRTLSGVAPITVLTAPRVCPGRCIFCPDDVRMPRSYLSNEPGAMRALMLDFDPYTQVDSRLATLRRTGHVVEKAELLILGGTWSDYPRDYQEWFVRRCFDALNQADSPSLLAAHRLNEAAVHRNTGLVIETRPDYITEDEVRWLRYLGVTRVQLGVQSLSDDILALNGRGHTVAQVRTAIRLLRSSGFKVMVHMMPNLLGATPHSDLAEWALLFADPALRPDEAKLYPTGLLRGTPLYDHYQRGAYHPYTDVELIDLLMACKTLTPEWCRLNRVMRDIPAPDIAAGVTISNLRQTVQQRLIDAGTPCRCIRCREVKGESIHPASIQFQRIAYVTDHSDELFLSAITPDDRLAGFLRLSLATTPPPLEELANHAVIRQIQVYGPALALGDEPSDGVQHQGLGRRLIQIARDEAQAAGFDRLAVIAAVGTRKYYRQLGFELGELYMTMDLANMC